MGKEDRAEEQLVRKAIRGNCDAYGQLIHTYQNYLYRTAFLYTKNEDEALDVVQDCILKAYESIKGLKKPEYFKTWITRILINSANQYHRRAGKTVPLETEAEAEAPAGASMEEKWDLYHAIDRLPKLYRTVVILKYYDDLKISEIASVMDIPEGSVKAYLYRAKRELRTFLEEDYAYAK